MTRASFLLFFVGNCHGLGMCSSSQATGWINVVSEKDICALSSILSQSSS